MSDGLLSQEDIDALTAGMNLGGDDADATPSVGTSDEGLRKFLKILSEQSSGVITTVLSRDVEFHLEQVIENTEFGKIDESLKSQALAIKVDITNELNGALYLVLGKNAVAILADLMLMGSGTADFSEDHKDAIQEIVNQIMGTFTTTLNSEIGISVEIAPQSAVDFDVSTQNEFVARGDLKINIEGFNEYPSYWYLDSKLLESLLVSKMSEGAQEEPMDTDLANLGVTESPTPQSSFTSGGASLDTAFTSASDGAIRSNFSSTGNKALDLLMDIELPITIELGRTKMSLKRVLELGPGAIVEMDRFAGEPVDILINDKVVAKGEVVTVDENFGVRLVGLVTPEERVRMLR
ncbi:MAG: flagellar motor switch protein FliN [Fibrobacter sp.]|nr:flagellar motor switch protein FliN [Fibrobacter sp.]